MATTWTRLRRLNSKKTKILDQIKFLQQCKHHGINPQSTIIKQRNQHKHSRRVIVNFSSKLLSAMIQDKMAHLDTISYECYITHLQLAKESHPIEMDIYMTKLHYTMEKLHHIITTKHHEKIQWLYQKQSKTNSPKKEQIIEPQPVKYHNLTNIILSKEEQNALELGPKYCFASPINNKNTITEIEDILTAIPQDQRDYKRGEIALAMKVHKTISNRKDNQAKKVLKNLRQNKDISIVKADKSQQIVIINTKEYQDKLQDHINKAKCKKLKKDPTAATKTSMTKLLKDPAFPEEIAKRIIIPSNPQVPKLFGRIKMHKPDHPARPVVSRCTAPTYQMEKVLYNLLAPLFNEYPNTIKSSKQFIDKTKDLQITPNERLYSLDVVSLYPSTPIDLALDIISKRLIETNQYTITQIAAIMKALRLITQSNVFTHKGDIYKQEDGAPMGSPLSALLAEVVLQKVEKEALLKLKFTPQIFLRYVDDCFVVISADQDINDLTNALNSIHPNIRFTIEKEIDKKIPFLDILITRKNHNLTFEVYRKPTSPPLLIRKDSNHPTLYKHSAFIWYLKRAKEFNSNDSTKQQEIEFIQNMATQHGYSKEDIPTLKEKQYQESTLQPIKDNTEFKFKSFSYIPHLSEKIGNIVRKAKIKIAHKCRNNLFDIVKKDRDETTHKDQHGIYQVPITNPEGEVVSNYIGLTTRKLNERMKEHQRDVEKGKVNNAIAKYTMCNNKTTPKWDSTTIIAKHSNRSQIHIREGIEIQYAKIPLCNIEPGYIIHNIWNQFLGPKTFLPEVT